MRGNWNNARVSWEGDRGSVILEFLVYGLLMQIVSLTLFLQVMGALSNQLAAESIARNALRSFVLFEVEPSKTALEILRNFRIDASPKAILTCNPECFNPGSEITLTVTINAAIAKSHWLR